MASPQTSVHSFSIKPTSKFVLLAYGLVGAFTGAASLIAYRSQARTAYLYAILAAGLAGLVWVAMRHVRLQLTSLTLDGAGLKFQDGFISKSTRMLNLTKVQDVRVDQGITDRLLGIGTLTLETAGESGRLVMPNVDRPHEIAQKILAVTQHPGSGASVSAQTRR